MALSKFTQQLLSQPMAVEEWIIKRLEAKRDGISSKTLHSQWRQDPWELDRALTGLRKAGIIRYNDTYGWYL
jgi:hypothetical protein